MFTATSTDSFVDDDDVTLLGAFYDPAAAPVVSVGGPCSCRRVAAVPGSHIIRYHTMLKVSHFADP
jgi:hypothetical protein